MYLKVITKKGITRLYFYESYYEPPATKGGKAKVKQRLVESLGTLDDLKQSWPDPVAHFKSVAASRSREQKEENSVSITIDMSTSMSEGEDSLKNVGYGIIKSLYKQLELDRFWKKFSKYSKAEYDLEMIFRLLVFSRVLFPASKKKTYENRGIYFEKFDGFSLDDVYHALSDIAKHKEALQKWLFEYSSKICTRDMSVNYFDCTNYYFDIGAPDIDELDEEGNPVDKNGNPTAPKYRKRGPEKNHRPDPIVSMGLLMDRNGIPLAYDLFPGNESEKIHMRPIINRVKTEFSGTRIIFVADRGLNTSDNIYYLNGDNKGDDNRRDGYVYGQSVRGADAEFKEWILAGGYACDKVTDNDGNDVIFQHKSRIYPKKIQVNVSTNDGKQKKKNVSIDQKQMVYYSDKYAKKQKKEREIMVRRAKDLVAHPKKYDRITSKGAASYVNNISFNKETGEIVDGTNLSINEEKIAEEEKLDGYYSIVTSELSMNDHELRNVYRGLSRIEDTFRVSKTEFLSRPVFVWTNEHIEGHFATCFTALVLIRLLQTKLGNKYPVGQILNALKKYNCVQIDATRYQFVYYDKILAECGKIFDLEMDRKYRTRVQIRRMLKY